MDVLAKVCPRCGRRFDTAAAFCQTDGTRLHLTDERTDPYIGQTLLDQFKIEEKIGAGGMGSVYRARQTTLHRDVAIKILHTELADNRDAVRRFKREARVCTALDHPNVVRVFLFGQLPDGSLYIVMEHLRGRSLLEVLQREGSLPVHRALHIATQTCDGVGEAHTQGVVHRDLKPENVVLITKKRDADFVKVLDFGIARVLWGDEQTQATQSGLVFGTARYISPEGAAGEPTDMRSDVYSLGVLTYQLLSGETPFDAPSPVGMLMKHIHSDVPHLLSTDGGEHVPEPVADVIMRALTKNPEGRYDDAQELGDALRTAAERAGFEVHGRRPGVPLIGPPSESGRPVHGSRSRDDEERSRDRSSRDRSSGRSSRRDEWDARDDRDRSHKRGRSRGRDDHDDDREDRDRDRSRSRSRDREEVPSRSGRDRDRDRDSDAPRRRRHRPEPELTPYVSDAPVQRSETLQGAPNPFGDDTSVGIPGVRIGSKGGSGSGRTLALAFAVGALLVAGGFGVAALVNDSANVEEVQVNVDELIDEARIALGSGLYDQPHDTSVLGLTDRVLEAHPGHAEALRLRQDVSSRLVREAQDRARAGETEPALQLYERARAFTPTDSSIALAIAELEQPAQPSVPPGVRTRPGHLIERIDATFVAVLTPGIGTASGHPRFVVRRGTRSVGQPISATAVGDGRTFEATHAIRRPGTYQLLFRLGSGTDLVEMETEIEVHRDPNRRVPREDLDPPPITTQGSVYRPPQITPAWTQTNQPVQNVPVNQPDPPPPSPPAPWTGGGSIL